MAESQVDTILEKKAPQYPQPDKPDEPRVMIRSALKLTRLQEDRLMQWAEATNQRLEGELGRENLYDADWYSTNPGNAVQAAKTFIGRRVLYEMGFANKVDYRAHLMRGIFEKSNHTVPLSRRIIQQQVSRGVKYFVGTEPFFAASAVGEQDKIKAEKINRFANYKLRKSKLKKTIERAIYGAFIRGETVIKTTHLDKSISYETEAVVLIGPDDKPVIAADGDYIYESDGEKMLAPVIPEGEDPSQFVPMLVLARDEITPLPPRDMRRYELRKIERRITHYKGPDSKPVYFRDFLCPLNAETVQDADQICHLYDMPVMSLVDMLYQNESITGVDNEFAAGLSLIREVASESGQPSSASQQPRPELDETGVGTNNLSEQGDSSSVIEPKTEIAETYLRFDVDEDGRYEDILLVYDRKNKVPLFYDHVANVTPDGKRPFRVVRINPVEGRWHGTGSMEIFEPLQKIVDLTFNRWNFGQSMSGRIDLFRPYNTYEGEADQRLEMNWGGTYTPLPDKTAKDVIETVYLEDIKANDLKDIIDFNMQIGMNMSGVANSNDTAAAGLDSTKLATGIRNMDLSGHELFGVYVSDMEEGIEDVIHQNVLVLLANLDEDEVFEFFEGDTAEMDVISPAEIATLDLNVKLEMTRYHAEQLLQQNLQAATVVREFYSLPFEVQTVTVGFYVNILKQFQIPNAERYLQPQQAPVQDAASINPQLANEAVAPPQPGQTGPLF